MGGSTQKAPTPYQPPNQAGSAAAFQAGAGNLANQGNTLYSTVTPELASIANNVANNPYYAQAQAGAQQAAATATGTVVPQEQAGAAQDASLANAATSLIPSTTGGAALAPGALAQTQSAIPAGVSAAGLAGGAYGTAMSAINPTTSGALATANPTLYSGLEAAINSYLQSQGGINNVNNQNATLMGDAATTLNTAYDPQTALYNRSYQQMMEQTNAINAQNGVTGSPFAAGIDAQNSSNFNIDWQNAQLARQIQALGAYGSAETTAAGALNSSLGQQAQDYTNLNTGAANTYSTLTNSAAGNLATLLGAGTSAYNTDINSAIANLTNLQNTGVNNYNSLTSGAANNAATLTSAATGANTAAADLNTQALNTQAAAAQLPSDVYLQQQQAALAATGAQITGANAASAQQQAAIGDQGQYLNIGQTAAQGAINAAQVNNQAAQSSAAGFGNLFGSLVGMFMF